jgi:hypothetical protein
MKGSGEGHILETLQLSKVDLPYKPSGWPKSASGRQPQKVRVHHLFGRPIGRKPPRAPVRNLSGRPSGREPPRALVCKDVQTQK